jgi:long-chain acyl-CoA synthetase
MLYNDQSPFTVGLLVPRRDAVMAWMKAHGHSPDTAEGQCAALRLLSSEIDAFRSGGRHGGLFPERWLPSSLAVLADGFTEQNGLMNSTLKMVRGRIVECHANRIREAFGADGKNVCNAQNRKAIRAMAEPAGTVVR